MLLDPLAHERRDAAAASVLCKFNKTRSSSSKSHGTDVLAKNLKHIFENGIHAKPILSRSVIALHSRDVIERTITEEQAVLPADFSSIRTGGLTRQVW